MLDGVVTLASTTVTRSVGWPSVSSDIPASSPRFVVVVGVRHGVLGVQTGIDGLVTDPAGILLRVGPDFPFEGITLVLVRIVVRALATHAPTHRTTHNTTPRG